MAVKPSFFVAFALLHAAFGYQKTAYTGFANNRITSTYELSHRRRRQLHSIHHHVRPSNSVVHLRSSQILHASFHNSSMEIFSVDKRMDDTKNTSARVNAAVSTIRQIILKKLSHASRHFRNALLAFSPLVLSLTLLLSLPAWANSKEQPLQSSSLDTPSSSYYLQNNPQYRETQPDRVISIETQRSSSNKIHKKDNSDYRIIKRRSNRLSIDKQKRTVKRVSLFVMATTFAASSYRASLRKTRIVRTATPFGRIRNTSPLGNGVSVIRVCMALGFDNTSDNDGNGADEGVLGNPDSLLARLSLEEKELYTKMAILSQNQVQLQGNDSSSLKQKVLGDYLSNVASTFLGQYKSMRYGSIDSIKLPFVEDAVRSFRQISKEERAIFDKAHQKQGQPRNESTKQTTFILATILLAIKGDHTSIQLPFGILRQRDMARVLSRIATDAKVEDCLVASEIMKTHDVHSINQYKTLTEKEVLEFFPDLVPLT